MVRMPVGPLPPPPDAPEEVHRAYAEAVRREREAQAREQAQRRVEAMARVMGQDVADRLRALEEIAWLAAKTNEQNWREVRDSALALLEGRRRPVET